MSFVVFGLLTLIFAVGLHRGLRPSRRGIAGPALFGVSGLALLFAAAIPLRQDAAGEVYDPGGHIVAGSAFFAASAVGLLVLSRRIASDPAWSGLALDAGGRAHLRPGVRRDAFGGHSGGGATA